jgi:Uma2 family endonuclease
MHPASHDQRTYLNAVPWEDYERLLALRGEKAIPRLAYLDGELEFTATCQDHERIKKTLARLVEAYADHAGLELDGFGSWTLKSRPKAQIVGLQSANLRGTAALLPGSRSCAVPPARLVLELASLGQQLCISGSFTRFPGRRFGPRRAASSPTSATS